MKRILHKLLFILFILFYSFSGYTQTKIIKGQVLDGAGIALVDVNVAIRKTADSTLIAYGATDKSGNFQISISDSSTDEAFLIAKLIGFKNYISSTWVISKPLNFESIILEEEKTNLKDVQITAKKRFIVQKNDRITVNVENSIVSNSGNVLDMLQKLPGLTVDAGGNISLRGKQGVRVYLNGKQSYLSASDLANMLKSMPSTNVSTVDIIANPSARFDAAGNSGIIIINTKKNLKDLYSASISSSVGVGKYFLTNDGINLSVNKKNVSLSASYFYTNNKTFRFSDLKRKVTNDENIYNFSQLSEGQIKDAGSAYNVNGIIDLNSKNKIGFSADGFSNSNKVNELNTTRIATPPSQLDSSLVVNNAERNKTRLFSSGLSYELKTDTAGGKLHAEINYSTYNRDGLGNLLNNYYDFNGRVKRNPDLLRNITPTKINIFSTQIDLNGALFLAIDYEAGLKYSNVESDNNYQFGSITNNEFILNTNRSNYFKYKEDIYASYLNFSKKISEYTIQLGFRLEQTKSAANSVTNNVMVNRSYTNLFPSLFIQREINANNQINLNYSRRIDRPDYQDLNPFVYYNDQYTYTVGNSFLKPQFTDNFQLSYTYKEFTLTAGFSNTKDVITQITQQDDETKITYSTLENLNKLKNYSLSISAPVTFTKWWDSYTYLEGYQNTYQSELSGQRLDNSKFTVNVFTEQNFKVIKDLYATISFNYRSSAYNGIFYFKPVYFINTGLQNKFFSNKLNAKLSFDDVFKTRKTRVITDYANMDYQLESGRDTRRVLLSLSYTFGSKKGKPKSINGMNKEERRRIKN
ncbi:outer membrane beta-barrel family protein [Pedobacter nototheniae]|uniref:outer membrane beta-barrel family protein n=1 Tax=Pedobacter nototheniae TaxID=2488994 RepID=UPI00292EA16F|nr:outer membrane beta-barrel family protein [Pedobacter nototheniae]